MRPLARPLFAAIALLTTLPGAGPVPVGRGLTDVRTYLYQFQRIEESSAVEALGKSAYDLLIVEPLSTYRSGANIDAKALVQRLRGKRVDRLVFAYLNLAEADANRRYWERSWKAPDGGKPGRPDFLAAPDPDGWKDTYLVRYWDPRWQELLLADLRVVLAAGYDGLCLDWCGAFENSTLRRLSESESRSAVRDMVDLVTRVRETARTINPGALLLLQNPGGLQDQAPRISTFADGVLYENTWYSGKAEADWSDERGGDVEDRSAQAATRREARFAQMDRWKAEGKPVFTLDYCLKPEHAREVYESAGRRGYVALVSRSALDRLTETPPPRLGDGGR
jgi:uncharacterized protein (TIGR01370 family)